MTAVRRIVMAGGRDASAEQLPFDGGGVDALAGLGCPCPHVGNLSALGFAVGLGAALMLLQGNIQTAITKAGTSVTDMFSKITSGAA